MKNPNVDTKRVTLRNRGTLFRLVDLELLRRNPETNLLGTPEDEDSVVKERIKKRFG